MEHNRQLSDALAGTEWQAAALETQTWQWAWEEQVEELGEILIRRVLTNECTLKDLRIGVAWVNALDKEVAQANVEVSRQDADGVEALSRRLAHHAGRHALKALSSQSKRSTALAVRSQQLGIRDTFYTDVDLSCFGSRH